MRRAWVTAAIAATALCAPAAAEPGAGTPNDDLTLFDFEGNALPSIQMFEDPVAASAR